jgi:hypothetical protein
MKARSKTQAEGSWKAHSEAWKASGITQRAYCEQEGISYRSFIHHHHRLTSQSKKIPLNFIEAKAEPAVISSHSTGLQLMLPNGIRISIGSEINPELLQTVLDVAGTIQC